MFGRKFVFVSRGLKVGRDCILGGFYIEFCSVLKPYLKQVMQICDYYEKNRQSDLEPIVNKTCQVIGFQFFF